MALSEFGALMWEFYIAEIGTWEKLWWLASLAVYRGGAI